MDYFILAVVVLINWVNGTFLAQYVFPRWGDEGGKGVWEVLVPYAAVLGLGCWSYYMTVVTHPGRVPVVWRESSNPLQADEYTPLAAGQRRFCPNCCHWKPPRTHHCSACKRCVLKYDHHCPWVGNCVGYYNHKYFLLLVTYLPASSWIVVGCMYHLATLCLPLLAGGGTDVIDPHQETCPFLGFGFYNFSAAYLFSCLSAATLTTFAMQHYYLLLRNRTTVETIQKLEEDALYDLGLQRNCYATCGPAWWKWPFPVPSNEISEQGGTRYETRRVIFPEQSVCCLGMAV